MKKYIVIKEVSATPAWRVDGRVYPKDGQVPRSMNREDGYKVIYEDGCESWLPKAVFEKNYKPAETFKDRLLIEQQELTERLGKLYAFVDNPKFKEIVTDSEQQELLYEQCQRMSDYLRVLNKRIVTLMD